MQMVRKRAMQVLELQAFSIDPNLLQLPCFSAELVVKDPWQ